MFIGPRAVSEKRLRRRSCTSNQTHSEARPAARRFGARDEFHFAAIAQKLCTQILTDIEEAEAQVNTLQTAPRGLLRIAVPVTFGLQVVAPAVSAYMARYPEVNFANQLL